jgi:hypothetical protein
MPEPSLIPMERIEAAILFIRDQKVILDRDLAKLYGVANKTLLQSVKRNASRFPADFAFQLSWDEVRALQAHFANTDSDGTSALRSQIVTLKRGAHIKYRPYAFTEQGVAMLSSVLRSDRAVSVNIEIMRAFVRMRQILASHADLARKLADLERKYDTQFRVVFDAIRRLMEPPPEQPRRGRIGFRRAGD